MKNEVGDHLEKVLGIVQKNLAFSLIFQDADVLKTY